MLASTIAQAKTWQIGKTRIYTFCSQVAALVNDGDTVAIDSGTYTNDKQVVWTKNNLLIRGVGGKPKLVAGTTIANDATNGKGIFVIDGTNTTIENIEFRNCKVQSHNGAGIRIEAPNVIVRHCIFNGNEMGILAGGTIPTCTIIVEYSEFLNGGSVANPGYQHNIYINHVDTFIFRYNFSHDAIAEGHELKSRASFNLIIYNRIANIYSVDSRTIDLPNGGTAIIMGNVIEQGQNSSNSNLLGYGLEGLINPSPHNLWICNNTFVNKKDKGSFINVPSSGTDTLYIKNNIFGGAKTGGFLIGSPTFLDSSNNLMSNELAEIGFVNESGFDYHLTPTSKAVNNGISISKIVKGHSLIPTEMYKDSSMKEPRPVNGKIDIGAFEYASTVALIEIKESVKLMLYPNPASTQLNITSNHKIKEGKILLYNSTGQRVLVVDINGKEATLTLQALPDGIYFLFLEQKGTLIYSGNFIKN